MPNTRLVLCGGKNTEVRYMHITASLDLKAGDCRCTQVLRHNCSSAAQKCKRRCQHPGVAYRDEFLKPGLALGLQDGDGILTLRRWLEFCQACPGHSSSQTFAGVDTVGDGRAGRTESFEEFLCAGDIFGRC